MTTTYCDNETCRFCSIDMELAKGGVKVCTVAPSFIRVDSLKDWMLKCNSYKYRPIGAVIEPIGMLGQDGLYPGQIRPFNEDYLVRSTVVVTAVGPKGGEECDT